VGVPTGGGRSGFVQVEGNRLTVPDFAGNLFFNTLGNLLINPKAGLLFIDFNSGELLHLSGRTEIIFEGPQVEAFQGAERLWMFHVEQVVRRPAALALRWRFDGVSPTSLLTGTWAQAAARLQAKALGDQWRPLRVVRIETESQGIRSIYLEPGDGVGLPLFHAGQHLPLRFHIDGEVHIRTYSLSSAPSDDFFRISVKRDGRVSKHLHEQVRVGAGAGRWYGGVVWGWAREFARCVRCVGRWVIRVCAPAVYGRPGSSRVRALWLINRFVQRWTACSRLPGMRSGLCACSVNRSRRLGRAKISI